MRIACIAVPDLALQALLRADPELRGRPVALADGPALTARILARTDEAARARVRTGVTATQARAVLPSLVVKPLDEAALEAARAALRDVGWGFAPRVEPDGDGVLLEVGDLGRLFETEREIGRAALGRLAAVGLDGRVGIAASKSVARLAAWATAAEVAAPSPAGSSAGERSDPWRFPVDLDDAVRVVPPSREAAFVAALPVARLAPSTEAAEALGRWGVRTAGALAALPVGEVSVRLGAEGARLHRLARAREAEPLAPRAPDDAVEEGLSLDFALVDLEALGFVLRGLVDRVLARLAARHLQCAGLVVRLALETRAAYVCEVPIAAPTDEAATLVELLRLAVARRPPDAAVVGVTLGAAPARARPSQMDFFRPAGPAPGRFAVALARLETLVDGDGMVGAPRRLDTHREEAIAVAETAWSKERRARRTDETPRTATGALALRRFRPAPAVEVLVDAGQVPRAISGVGVAANVVVAAGPYRASGEWWSSGGWSRDLWDVHATDGTVYRLSCDGRGRWFLEGYYD